MKKTYDIKELIREAIEKALNHIGTPGLFNWNLYITGDLYLDYYDGKEPPEPHICLYSQDIRDIKDDFKSGIVNAFKLYKGIDDSVKESVAEHGYNMDEMLEYLDTDIKNYTKKYIDFVISNMDIKKIKHITKEANRYCRDSSIDIEFY